MKLCGFDVGLDKPFFLIAGPCVIESMQLQLDVAGKLKKSPARSVFHLFLNPVLIKPIAHLALAFVVQV